MMPDAVVQATPDLLAHMVRGEGAPALLLNGGTMSMGAWEPVARPLEERFRVIRCDLRGQLLSPGTPPPTFSGHASEVVRLLDALGIDSVHLAGASFGGFTALTLAAEHPQRVRSLVAITASERITEEMWAGASLLIEAARAAADGGDGGVVFDLLVPATFSEAWRRQQGEALQARRAAVGRLPREWFAALVSLLEALRGLDLRPFLPRITCPTLVVGGELDRTFPVEHSQALARAIRGSELAIVQGAPHGMIVEDAERTAALIAAFFAEAESVRSWGPGTAGSRG
jgi:pimeloyl-ACP methyl ester carboxylesterase